MAEQNINMNININHHRLTNLRTHSELPSRAGDDRDNQHVWEISGMVARSIKLGRFSHGSLFLVLTIYWTQYIGNGHSILFRISQRAFRLTSILGLTAFREIVSHVLSI